MIRKVIVCTIITIVFICNVIGQQYNHFLNPTYNYELNKALDSTPYFHSSIKPYVISDVNKHLNYEDFFNTKKISFSNKKYQKIKDIIFNNHLVRVKEDDFTLLISPSFNLEIGRDFTSSIATYTNSRGIQIMGSIGKYFSFFATIYENQARFPKYVNDFIDDKEVVPGQGLKRNFGNGGYDYSKSSGYISYTPSKYFNIQFGAGKNFIGDGYRSLLLSDNSFNYPFLKLTTTIWKLKYINLFAEFQAFNNPYPKNRRFDKKYAAIHYLSWNINKRLSIGVFEAIIFPAKDVTGNRGFEINYLNPIIFYRPVEFSIGSPDNALLGLNFSYLVGTKNKIYGQFIFDEFKIKELTNGKGSWTNKFGYQLGVKFYDFFNTENLFLQLEYNRVRPYTYAHRTPVQNYGHYNQPLAHPFGANFWEFLTIANYHKKRFYFRYEFIYSKYGKNIGDNNYGKDIFLSTNKRQEYDNRIAQGLMTSFLYNNLECSYLINPSYNLNFVIGFTSRIAKNDVSTDKTTFFYIGLRTSTDNFYHDF
jgi:hypothetical protein